MHQAGQSATSKAQEQEKAEPLGGNLKAGWQQRREEADLTIQPEGDGLRDG